MQRQTVNADAAMERYADGDEGAFPALYDAIAPRLLGHLRRHTPTAADAEDLLQQTFLQIHRARGSFIRGASVRPWAFRIAHCLLVDRIRRGTVEARILRPAPDGPPDVPGHEAPADEMVQQHELARRVREVLARLPDSQRVAFELVRLDQLSLAEAAQFLETTPTAVKLRVFRAAEALRAALGDAALDVGGEP